MTDIHSCIDFPNTESEATQFALMYQDVRSLEQYIANILNKDQSGFDRLRTFMNVRDQLIQWTESHTHQYLVTADSRYIYFAGVPMYQSNEYLKVHMQKRHNKSDTD